MIDEAVGQADADKAHRAAQFVEDTRDFRAGAADEGILFDADKQRMFRSQLCDQFAVDRFDEAHVGHRGVEHLAGFERRAKHSLEALARVLFPWASRRGLMTPTPNWEGATAMMPPDKAERLTGYKTPREFYVVGELPKSMLGKVLRAQVKEQLGALTPLPH